jgi:DNA-binding GntR family transcriptional regulator
LCPIVKGLWSALVRLATLALVTETDATRAAYRRIADDLRADIRAGALTVGSRIPSVRALSDRYGVAQGTAIQAVRQLAAEGLVATSSGRGTYVKAVPRAEVGEDALEALAKRVAQLEGQVRKLEKALASEPENPIAE